MKGSEKSYLFQQCALFCEIQIVTFCFHLCLSSLANIHPFFNKITASWNDDKYGNYLYYVDCIVLDNTDEAEKATISQASNHKSYKRSSEQKYAHEQYLH